MKARSLWHGGKFLPSTAGVVMCFKFANADHIVVNES